MSRERVIRCGHGVVLHLHDEDRASSFTEALAVASEKAMRRKDLYEDETQDHRPRRLGRHRCKALGGRIPS